MAKKSIPARCLAMSGLFEAELLTETEGPATERQAWLDSVRKAVPSCFCSQNHLQ